MAEAVGDTASRVFALSELGEARRKNDDLTGALAALNEALELDPKSAFALATRGQVLLALERTGEATEALRAALAIDPNMPWARTELAEALRLDGDYAAALSEIDTALREAETGLRREPEARSSSRRETGAVECPTFGRLGSCNPRRGSQRRWRVR